MKTHPECTYWYQITILVDTESDGHRKTATIRIPVICISPGEKLSICTFVDPGSAKVVSKNIPNSELFDSALWPEMNSLKSNNNDNTINLSEWSVAYAANDQKISVMLWPIKPYMENPFIIVPGKDGSLQKKPLPKTCGIIEPIIEIHNPEPKFIPMQVCPVCAGEGRITSKSTSAMFQECPLCKGQRAIPMAKA